ncbi:MAG: hypothetical protein LBI82_07955 [Dysgonamonadaceae bacterium]|jgi:hypothetical protein|nr:hypothetical protein [Dysgonamonadaceae bacterium]
METTEKQLLRKIRFLVLFFIVALIVSGITAFPLVTEMKILTSFLGIDSNLPPADYSGLRFWIATVNEGLIRTSEQYPFMQYGSDWLAFAHLVIAVAFIGLYREPVRNKWLIYWGMIACAGILPLALICGYIRQIPFFWQMIDSAFGVFGFIPLYILHVWVKKLEEIQIQ